MLKVLGVSGLTGLTGHASAARGNQSQNPQASSGPGKKEGEDDDQMFEQIPALDIPVIDAYYEEEKVWFIHTSASTQQMANHLEEMIHSPVLHVPKLDDIVNTEALADIYVFKNGVDRSDAEPWGGGPFGYQIDILDSVPGDEDYTPLRHPNIVTWNDNADPRIITSVSELMEAREAGSLTIKETNIVVNAPIVEWPDGSLGGLHVSMGPSMMQDMCDMENMSGMCGNDGRPGCPMETTTPPPNINNSTFSDGE